MEKAIGMASVKKQEGGFVYLSSLSYHNYVYLHTFWHAIPKFLMLIYNL